MQNAGEIPAWFIDELTALVALYPSATANRATAIAWWRYLSRYPQPALAYAFGEAPHKSPQFMPSAEIVREIAAAWRPPTPRPSLETPALEEHVELPPELAAIRERQRCGEITAHEATHEFLRWTMERLP